jgi:hypothetical protein
MLNSVSLYSSTNVCYMLRILIYIFFLKKLVCVVFKIVTLFILFRLFRLFTLVTNCHTFHIFHIFVATLRTQISKLTIV